MGQRPVSRAAHVQLFWRALHRLNTLARHMYPMTTGVENLTFHGTRETQKRRLRRVFQAAKEQAEQEAT
ncbi:MAG: hypothetical protein ABR583_08325 [Gaiellaceae bacterium]